VVRRVLADPARRPAIVYAPTRKEADALGEELSREFPAASYHAGMVGSLRDRVQSRFLANDLEVIVATIAFGMGIDKSDVRTVIHTALPGTLEGYYQEIGRAGRDGKPSQAILLYSWADRRTHEFFYNRDYPEVEQLERIHKALGPEPQSADTLARRLGIEEDLYHKALEKLWIHGGALLDPEMNATRGDGQWQQPYSEQRQHREAQLDQMVRFASGRTCRMLALVGHFGDQEDSGLRCGHCDVCAPEACEVRRFRGASTKEQEVMALVLEALREWDDQSTGKLFQKTGESHGLDRRGFERLLGGMVRAGLLVIRQDSFVKDGRHIEFQRAGLTPAGNIVDEHDLASVQVSEEPKKAPKKGKKKTTRKKSTSRKSAKKSTARPLTSGTRPSRAEVATLFDALKAWRLKEARRRRIPAFRIMPNRTLEAVAASRPRDEGELLAVHGMGPTLVSKYGEALLGIVAREG
jgi:DNA topoisomerase-3